MEPFHFPLIVHHAKFMQLYVTLLFINIDENLVIKIIMNV